MKKRNICIMMILTILVLFLTGCSDNKIEEDLNKKVDAEIEYMDAELIKIISQLNNINFSNYMLETRKVDTSSGTTDRETSSSNSSSNNSQNETTEEGENSQSNQDNKTNQKINVTEMINKSLLNTDYNDIDWEKILVGLEVFNTAWNTIILDLYKLNITNTDITNFSNNLDQLLINIKNKDKTAALTSVATLYSYLPKYLNSYANDSSSKELTETKLHILNSYVGASTGDWTYSDNELTLAEQTFSNVMRNTELVNQKEYNVNRTYIALKELQSSNQYRDTNIFFLKYRNFIQEIDVL